MEIFDDKYWMRMALREAEKALELKEVPVGCVIIHDNKIIGRGFNQREMLKDPTAHAEMLAISAACDQMVSWRLEHTVMYVTMEPCPMCAGAIVLARIPRLVYAVTDPKAGACGTLYDIARDDRLNHMVDVTLGVLEDEARGLVQDFFKKLREDKSEAG
ncbi:MAG: tRNA-specific adenosine deaminase [candidate division Zixibacteria bacterium]|nr:nucleoside deaminase [candidate division Zixibacteria bacterium]NIR66302.1 nucleoside deaminase [candidate division Zixibacteria bacterium]NIS17621.1 nucleoside deaminase [candidate division Zixibacteria bacterium]NIS47892.1 nucleoside deaminase [candidate division Zixibacteria bacterium]NIU16010.1 nucleoside deaminase [candidate division Zixibacteria bacterium]